MTELVKVGETGIQGVAVGDWLIAGEDDEVRVTAQDPRTQVTGQENLRPSDVPRLPRLTVVQKRNKPFEGCEPGEIAYTGTVERFNEIEAIFLRFLEPTRVRWPEEYDADNEPLCFSEDGKIPAAPTEWRVATDPRPGPCRTCPDAQWPEGEGGRPDCNDQRNFLVALMHEQALMPAALTLQGTGLQPAKEELTNLMTRYGIRFSIVMTTVFVEDQRGDWYIPRFEKGVAMSGPGIDALLELREAQQSLLEAGQTALGAYIGDAAVHEPTGQVKVDTEESLAPKAGNGKPKRKKTRRPPEPEPRPLAFGDDDDPEKIPF